MPDNKTDSGRDAYEGEEFIAGENIPQGQRVVLKISKVSPKNSERDARGKVIEQFILDFEETDKRLVLGLTNTRLVAYLHGRKTDKWVGREITIVRRYLPAHLGFGVHNSTCVRVYVDENADGFPSRCRGFMGSEKPLAKE